MRFLPGLKAGDFHAPSLMKTNKLISERDRREKDIVLSIAEGDLYAPSPAIDLGTGEDRTATLEGASLSEGCRRRNIERYCNSCVILTPRGRGSGRTADISTLEGRKIGSAPAPGDALPDGKWIGVLEVRQPYGANGLGIDCKVTALLSAVGGMDSLWARLRAMKDQAYTAEKKYLERQMKTIGASAWLDPDKRILRRTLERGYTNKHDT